MEETPHEDKDMPDKMSIFESWHIKSDTNGITHSAKQDKQEIRYVLDEFIINKNDTPSHEQINSQVDEFEFVDPDWFENDADNRDRPKDA